MLAVRGAGENPKWQAIRPVRRSKRRSHAGSIDARRALHPGMATAATRIRSGRAAGPLTERSNKAIIAMTPAAERRPRDEVASTARWRSGASGSCRPSASALLRLRFTIHVSQTTTSPMYARPAPIHTGRMRRTATRPTAARTAPAIVPDRRLPSAHPGPRCADRTLKEAPHAATALIPMITTVVAVCADRVTHRA